MEKMPYRDDWTMHDDARRSRSARRSSRSDWRQRLPVLRGAHGRRCASCARRTRRRCSRMLTTEEVARFISPPPTTVEGFERFIAWTHRAARGRQLRLLRGHARRDSTRRSASSRCAQLEPGFGTAEWGFAIGSAFWGTGVFQEGAELVLDFAFDTIGVHRLEARAAVRERPRQRRAAQDRRGAGRRAAQVVPAQRRVSRPGAVRRSRRGLARRCRRALAGRDPSGALSARSMRHTSKAGDFRRPFLLGAACRRSPRRDKRKPQTLESLRAAATRM